MKKFRYSTWLLRMLLGALLALPAIAEEHAKPVMITAELKSFSMTHNGETVTVMRNQDRSNRIVDLYQPTHRGKIQPMHPFAPHQVTTIGALEMINFMQQLESGDDGLLIIDSRTRDWARRGTLAGSINIAFTEFKDEERALEFMEEWFDVLNTGLSLDFSNAKTLVLFCNGIWCGQSPTTIRTLVRMGYPAAKIHYFRGGMQNWQSLGLTVVSP
jgi:rhodanese-related sulfurtransferase